MSEEKYVHYSSTPWAYLIVMTYDYYSHVLGGHMSNKQEVFGGAGGSACSSLPR